MSITPRPLQLGKDKVLLECEKPGHVIFFAPDYSQPYAFSYYYERLVIDHTKIACQKLDMYITNEIRKRMINLVGKPNDHCKNVEESLKREAELKSELETYSKSSRADFLNSDTWSKIKEHVKQKEVLACIKKNPPALRFDINRPTLFVIGTGTHCNTFVKPWIEPIRNSTKLDPHCNGYRIWENNRILGYYSNYWYETKVPEVIEKESFYDYDFHINVNVKGRNMLSTFDPGNGNGSGSEFP